ncbi:hypothetical protein chiPu_0033526 [Chiloscyllium punctatum]|uniref:Uncharacterized protein n=1 Tax=Chiloscyllium punctatum TaxID=137246 RepID=A0A401U3I5_CHIPU|nr:hypothetical protein [Chiloscyllium punctatum]
MLVRAVGILRPLEEGLDLGTVKHMANKLSGGHEVGAAHEDGGADVQLVFELRRQDDLVKGIVVVLPTFLKGKCKRE